MQVSIVWIGHSQAGLSDSRSGREWEDTIAEAAKAESGLGFFANPAPTYVSCDQAA